MSNSLAIAAVTLTLRNLLFQEVNADVSGTDVTTRPPDKARNSHTGNQVNLFLYQTSVDAAWRNMDIPGRVKPGETGQPPLPLSLSYLITAYGENDEDSLSHRLLGRAMSVLHDHPILGSDEIRLALANNDLYEQVERVRVTPQSLSLEDLSKLWTTFQTQYRISAAYQASVVLIESTRPSRTPPPVLTRGQGDRGAITRPDTAPPFPILEGIELPNHQPSARLGDTLTLSGHKLDGVIGVRVSHRLLDAPIELPVTPLVEAAAGQIRVLLPDEAARFPAGFYTLAAVVGQGSEPAQITNALSFSLAPRITSTLPIAVTRDIRGGVRIDLQCSPNVRPEQQVSLLLGDREIRTSPDPAQPNRLTFQIDRALPGDYLLRLRVDGVDSLLADRSVTPPVFDPSQRVTIR
ncbi:MAG: DUF4255 domain-containing protein [Dehalococcoidia bacterium]